MAIQRASYVLENENETARLEEQALLPGYNLEQELRDVRLPTQGKLLDAGCGSGVACRYLARKFPSLSLVGVDRSELRLRQAKELCQRDGLSNRIELRNEALERLSFDKSSFDGVFCRYVFEHIQTQREVSREFLRVLKPGAMAVVVDFDGLLFNLSHTNAKLRKMLEESEKKLGIDLYVGRKIPQILRDAGFEDVRWSVDVVGFHGKDLAAELKLTEERLSFALPLFAKVFKSKRKALEFRDLYCAEMMKPGNTLFYNKFVVTGRKPRED